MSLRVSDLHLLLQLAAPGDLHNHCARRFLRSFVARVLWSSQISVFLANDRFFTDELASLLRMYCRPRDPSPPRQAWRARRMSPSRDGGKPPQRDAERLPPRGAAPPSRLVNQTFSFVDFYMD